MRIDLALSLLLSYAPPTEVDPANPPVEDAADSGAPAAPEDELSDAGAPAEASPKEGAKEGTDAPEAGSDDADPQGADSEVDGDTDEAGSDAESEGLAQAEGPEAGDGGDEEIDMSSIFGDPDELELEELPDAEESDGSSDSGGGGLASKIPGDLSFQFGFLTSVYIDIDDVYVGADGPKRWAKGYNSQRGGLGRNENRLEFYLDYRPVPKIQLVGGIEPVFMGASDVGSLEDLSSRQLIKPFHVESDKAYVAFLDIAPGLDIKAGRQIVVWGTADKFNPTNNINPDDLEDRPLFTEPIANQMLVIDYSRFEDRLRLQGVWVPIFYPALLPPSAGGALQDPRSPVPFVNLEDRDDLRYLQNYIEWSPRYTPEVTADVYTPDPHLNNSQFAFKAGTRFAGIDLSASYYYGFHDIPLPVLAESTKTFPDDEQLDQQPNEARCCFRSDVDLVYPRMHVAGLDFATQLPFLGDMGLWGELGVFFPTKEYTMRIEMPLQLPLPSDPDTRVDVVEGVTVPYQPFFKLTTGLDYTIGKHVLLLAQYMHGFIDEFGAGNMGEYVMAGTQLQFKGRHVIAQLFGVFDIPKLPDDEFSVVIAPELALTPPAGYLTFKLGGFGFVGKFESKFAQRATGTSIAYLRLQGRF